MSAYHSTKHDSAAAEVIAELSDVATGFGSDATGDVDSPTGYFALVILDQTCDLGFSDHTNYPTGDYVGELARTYGVTEADVIGAHIVTWDSRGFVSVETFPTDDDARTEYACRSQRFDEWADPDADPEGHVYVCGVVGHGYHTL